MTAIVRNLPDQIVELVRDRILSGSVAADRPIRQDAMAAELGVSKIPLREALTRLLGRGAGRALALSRMGVMGDDTVLPWLVGRMREPMDALAAGAAFRDLVAVEPFDAGLFASTPKALGDGFAGLEPGPWPHADPSGATCATWSGRRSGRGARRPRHQPRPPPRSSRRGVPWSTR